jgi:uncharacterized protein YcaQ
MHRKLALEMNVAFADWRRCFVEAVAELPRELDEMALVLRGFDFLVWWRRLFIFRFAFTDRVGSLRGTSVVSPYI